MIIRKRWLLSALLVWCSNVAASESISQDVGTESEVTYDYHQIVPSETVCRSSLRQKLLEQQIAFSNSHNSPEERRFAEESIDEAREAYSQKQSYCDATLALTKYLDRKEHHMSQAAKDGQVQSFASTE
ncbi:hypothetical protein [Enterovibrio coralii]|uniref:Uncharacterized protein n=1 Tax=Enterovibrio coralii TaxID=294935 RepID=A0A135I4W6_9GAMM|nr:hypothetical protein [Enterovibrio coralii]KXF80468.1 hypothetical protein ATN88_22230 [Enterovibrio coralii]